MSPLVRIPLGSATVRAVIGDLVRDTRTTIGWTQAGLADRSLTSQATIWRLETSQRGNVDLDVVERVLHELGLRVTLEVDGAHVLARRRQRDLVHSRTVARLAARLRRRGWVVATEVQLGATVPIGWIDILAFRPADNALLVIEVKTALPDAGELLRQVALYEREAMWAAQRQGWRPTTSRVAVVVLDTSEVRDSLVANRALLQPTLAGEAHALVSWIASPGAGRPGERTIVATDLRRRHAPGLFPTVLAGRRSPAAYAGYAAAADALRTAAPPRSTDRVHR